MGCKFSHASVAWSLVHSQDVSRKSSGESARFSQMAQWLVLSTPFYLSLAIFVQVFELALVQPPDIVKNESVDSKTNFMRYLPIKRDIFQSKARKLYNESKWDLTSRLDMALGTKSPKSSISSQARKHWRVLSTAMPKTLRNLEETTRVSVDDLSGWAG